MKNLSLNMKISLILALGLVVSIVIGGLSVYDLAKMKAELDDFADVAVPRTILALEYQSNFRELNNQKYRLLRSRSVEESKPYFEEMNQLKEVIDENLQKGKSTADDEAKPAWETAESQFRQWWELANQMLAAMDRNDVELAQDLSSRQRPFRTESEVQVARIVEFSEQAISERRQSIAADFQKTLMTLIIVIVAGILISAALAWLVLTAVSKGIDRVVASLREGSTQVNGAAGQIASASSQLSQASTENAAALEETAASVEELSSMVQKNTENASSTAELSQKSAGASRRGQEVMSRLMESISQIDSSNSLVASQLNESNQQIAGIVAVIEQISKKTQVINEIVNKTELLSFNASVEAARAGEHGKGFAVVAQEVGNLARLSGVASQEISTLLGESTETVNRIVSESSAKVGQLIDTSKKSVDEGIRVARECDQVLREIVSQADSVSQMSGEISSASREQAHGIHEITKAMSQLDQMNQQNASASEETAAAAEELSSQSESLMETVTLLVRTIHGARGIDA